MRSILVALLLFGCLAIQAQDQLYQVKLIRAAPGQLLEVIELLKADMKNHQAYGIDKPYLIRHSQGDHWDLMMIYPVNDLASYFSDEFQKGLEGSNSLGKTYGDDFYKQISFQEESIVKGPEKALFNDWFQQYGYYHIEIFTALAGKQAELLKEREMENVYLEEINRRPNFIFTKVTGASWDIFTIGCYTGIKDYASSADIPVEEEDRAAKVAGFESVYTIGSYLRSLILVHHDTLGGGVTVD
ncbi:MAG: hypothetical protein R8G66_21870 [Cytophagales bacterium]|nr:hypothetical protein [Cytophagales bacterium]